MLKKMLIATAVFGAGFVTGVILKNAIDSLLGYTDEDDCVDIDWDRYEAGMGM
jgi:hypothetical protein